MENSRNPHFLSCKLHAVLHHMMKSCALPLSRWGQEPLLSLLQLPPISSPVLGTPVLVPEDLTSLDNVPRCTGDDARIPDMPKRSYEALPFVNVSVYHGYASTGTGTDSEVWCHCGSRHVPWVSGVLPTGKGATVPVLCPY